MTQNLIEGGVAMIQPGNPVKILDLARHLIEEAGFHPDEDIPIQFIGLRPGDKMTEIFVSSKEFAELTPDGRLRRIIGPWVSPEEFDDTMKRLEDHAQRRDLASLMDVVFQMVPEYYPSDTLLRLLNRAPA